MSQMFHPLRYYDAEVCLREIPDEISLGINIIGCPNHCEGCHSPHLWEENRADGFDLTKSEIKLLLDKYKDITCILFFGGDWDGDVLNLITTIKYIKEKYKNKEYKIGLYSGNGLWYTNDIYNELYSLLDYIKVGRYIKEQGGLNKPTTNQRLYKITTYTKIAYINYPILENITYKLFDKESI